MNESFLYYIWQFQYFDKVALTTTSGDQVEISKPGILNHHAGPDFEDAMVKIDGIAWGGSIEIHTHSSDWREHKHHHDKAYENVILHVVWQDDEPVIRSDETFVPTLVLKDRISAALVRDYQKLIHNAFSIPCMKSFPLVDDLIKHSMLDRALFQRMETKAFDVMELLKRNNNDWEETAWQVIARNFGFKVNADPFQQLSKSMPYRIVLKHADKPIQVEALLFGQAGFLELGVGDDYYHLLQREYRLLESKYSLRGAKLSINQWRFLRLRPANFPTIRIAQFCALVQQRTSLFSRILDAVTVTSLVETFSIVQSEYWLRHYRFNKPTKTIVSEIGTSSIENILINSVVPLLVAWGKRHDEQTLVDRAIELLYALPSESNSITRAWELLGYKSKSAFDSQALIELYNNFCQKKNCLTCVIGVSLLKPL